MHMTMPTQKQVKRMVGEIVSHRTAKTAVVRVVNVRMHPKYHKRYTVAKKYLAHDEHDAYQVGNRVEIAGCRPLSARKRFIITRKVE